MKDKTKNIITTFGFIIIIITILILNIIKPDETISKTERRKLAQFPKITEKEIFDGNLSDKLEKYAMDQFVGRDTFRKIKYYFNTNILQQKDTNKLFIRDNSIYKIEYPLNENAIKKSAQKIENIIKQYLNNNNIYYAIIPDKNYYLDDKHLKIDYSKLTSILKNSLNNYHYIDLFPELSLEDYYRTDLHWKQENIEKIAKKISSEMGIQNNSNLMYKKIELGNFYGTYYGQTSANINADKINYLTNDILENCTTYNYETKRHGKIYDLEKYKKSIDKYDVFLSGATPLISIENPNSTSDKELLLFRDSFGSSVAPLLVENYKKITLIDIRYINSKILSNYIDFENQDVLFLYSTVVLNQDVFK